MVQTWCGHLILLSLFAFMVSQVSAQSTDEPRPAPPSPDAPLPPPPPAPPHLSSPPPPAPPLQHRKDSRQKELELEKAMETRQILSLTLPMVGVLGIIVLATCGIIYMLRRAKYGALCCLNPNLNYHLQVNEEPKDERDGDDWSPPRSGTPPPDYTPSTADPPVYLDALQDVILSSGTVGSEHLESAPVSPNHSQQPAILPVSPNHQPPSMNPPTLA